MTLPMNRYWSAQVHGLQPYVPGEQPKLANLIKLNTNESPYGPSPKALAAMREALGDITGDDLRLYPDPESTALRAAIAQVNQRFTNIAPEQVFVGNGSDEVLAHVFVALLKQSKPLWFPDITYSFYPVYCRLYSVAHETVALTDDFRIAPEDYAATGQRRAGAIILANPNAPTGVALSLAEIERIVVANPDAPVVIDEAYVDFGAQSAVSLVSKYDNLLIVQTLSKSRALAGLRVGYAIGHAGLIQALERVKNSFNSYPLNRIAQAGATAAVLDQAHLRATCQAVIRSREWLSNELKTRGFEVLPSQANFVYARHPNHTGAHLAAALRDQGILVRHFSQPRIADFLRISIGTDAQCQALINTLAVI